jgi:tetratricopeptide (TPR) repeat protein
MLTPDVSAVCTSQAIPLCSTLIEGDETNAIAYFRRGQANLALGNLQGAFQDILAAKQLLPTHPALTSALRQVIAFARGINEGKTHTHTLH